MRARTVAVMWIAGSLAFAAAGQLTTATLTGQVTLSDRPASGVVVTISSPALQGTRSVDTSVEGTYTFPALPPGEYRVTFALSGTGTVIRSVPLHVAEVRRVDAQLLPGISEEITVIPEPAGGIDSTQASSTMPQELVSTLPTDRGIIDVARLAPGVHDSGPQGQLSIHGAPSTENLFVVNGAVITEGVRNQPHNLFIEDAILETTVLSVGVSAEFGRFTGGVVTVLTKSGGNEFDGSLRDNVSNDQWTAKTPLAAESDHLDEVNHDYEATLGGRIVRDRLWFFTAARSAQRTQRRQTLGTAIPYTWKNEEARLEVKATANLGAHQTIVGSWLDVDAREENRDFGAADLVSLVDVELPHSLAALHYSAILPRTIVIEGQYTRKNYDLIGGGTSRERVGGTPVYDLETGFAYGAPLLCGVCGGSYRDNRELALKATMFHASARLGTHSVVAGVSDYREMAADDGHVTASDFDVYTPTRFENGTTYLVASPGETIVEWWPVFIPSAGDEFTTRALYVNDRVDLGRRWSFNLGLRYERSIGKDQGGAEQAEGSSWSPRLGVSYDLGGDGRHYVSAGFHRYAAKIDEFVARLASPAGQAANYIFLYDGPPLNTGATLLPFNEVLGQIFDWFESVGGTSNTDYLLNASSPVGLTVEDKLRAPVMDEISAGYGRQLGRGGFARVDLIRRKWHDFYSLRATQDTGTVDDPASGGVVDRIVVENNDAGLSREYRGIALQGAWERGKLRVGGNYTLSRLYGNIESDTASRGTTAVQSPVAYYPEYTAYPESARSGFLAADERHRANLWAALRIPTRFADIDASLLQTYHSGRRYSATAPIDVRSFVSNPGYQLPPNVQTYMFTERGGLEVDDITATNAGLILSRRVASVELFLDTEVLNVFNEHRIENPALLNRTVRTNRTDRNLAAFDPFETTPVECPRGVATSSAQCKGIAHFQLVPQFGTPTRAEAYQVPRTFQFSFGVRF